jgi:hypothetical protein
VLRPPGAAVAGEADSAAKTRANPVTAAATLIDREERMMFLRVDEERVDRRVHTYTTPGLMTEQGASRG